MLGCSWLLIWELFLISELITEDWIGIDNQDTRRVPCWLDIRFNLTLSGLRFFLTGPDMTSQVLKTKYLHKTTWQGVTLY